MFDVLRHLFAVVLLQLERLALFGSRELYNGKVSRSLPLTDAGHDIEVIDLTAGLTILIGVVQIGPPVSTRCHGVRILLVCGNAFQVTTARRIKEIWKCNEILICNN